MNRNLLIAGTLALLFGIGIFLMPYAFEWTETQYSDTGSQFDMTTQMQGSDGNAVAASVMDSSMTTVIGVLLTFDWHVVGEYVDWTSFSMVGNAKVEQRYWDYDVYAQRVIDSGLVSSQSIDASGDGSITVALDLDALDEREFFDEAEESFQIIISATIVFSVNDQSGNQLEDFTFTDSTTVMLQLLSGTWTVTTGFGTENQVASVDDSGAEPFYLSIPIVLMSCGVILQIISIKRSS